MFYINPPMGKVALHILENSVFTRLEYLRLLEDDNTDSFAGNFEYLLENSVCDSIGHFTLRLMAAASPELWPSWVRSEGLLLKQRLDNLSARQMHRLFRNILKNVKRRDCDDSPVSQALMEMSMHFLKPRVFNHIVQEEHSEDCRKYQCRVPFTAIPELVEHRKIDLYRGYGTVVCSQWKIVLLSLFRNFILEEKKRILHAENLVASDPRLFDISKRIRGPSFDKFPVHRSITAKNIDAESIKFPPCMQHLHTILRDKHRLSHHARFHYSLFLKECGMKIDEATNYWREEYTKPHTCQSGCTHSWQTNERKFVYSIRHLYGLEGGRKNYKTPDCKKICNDVPGLRYEGGCPFKHWDSKKLGTLLRTCMNETEAQERLNNVRKPEIACSDFLKMIHKREDEDLVIHSPVQYYMKVTETK